MILSRVEGRRFLLSLSAPALFFAAFTQAHADFAEGVEAYDGGDLEMAVAAWREAAATGDMEAVVALAGLYAQGSGLPQDWQSAVRLYRQAAEAGHKIAQLNLGELFATGHGVERDLVQAYLWYGLAAEQGSLWAARELEMITGLMAADDLARAADLLARWKRPSP